MIEAKEISEIAYGLVRQLSDRIHMAWEDDRGQLLQEIYRLQVTGRKDKITQKHLKRQISTLAAMMEEHFPTQQQEGSLKEGMKVICKESEVQQANDTSTNSFECETQQFPQGTERVVPSGHAKGKQEPQSLTKKTKHHHSNLYEEEEGEGEDDERVIEESIPPRNLATIDDGGFNLTNDRCTRTSSGARKKYFADSIGNVCRSSAGHSSGRNSSSSGSTTNAALTTATASSRPALPPHNFTCGHNRSNNLQQAPSGFKYSESARGKNARDDLKGFACPECEGYYRALEQQGVHVSRDSSTEDGVKPKKRTRRTRQQEGVGMGYEGEDFHLYDIEDEKEDVRAGGLASVYGHPQQHQQGGKRRQESRDLVQLHSRHRNRSTPPSTPEGFWDLTVLTPEEWKKDNKN